MTCSTTIQPTNKSLSLSLSLWFSVARSLTKEYKENQQRKSVFLKPLWKRRIYLIGLYVFIIDCVDIECKRTADMPQGEISFPPCYFRAWSDDDSNFLYPTSTSAISLFSVSLFSSPAAAAFSSPLSSFWCSPNMYNCPMVVTTTDASRKVKSKAVFMVTWRCWSSLCFPLQWSVWTESRFCPVSNLYCISTSRACPRH